METTKKIAGDILLFLYKLQREGGLTRREMIHFGGINLGNVGLANKTDLGDKILKLSNDSAADAYNGLHYLIEKRFISCNHRQTTAHEMFFNFRVAASGVDIIEAIERGPDEKKQFNITFNIKVADTINVESLLKLELDSLLKTSLI